MLISISHLIELELQENLEASEKLMATLNESWEDKLAKTQEIHIAREQALEELGITLDNDRALVGVYAPKKWPHLVNLNEVRMGFGSVGGA
jgi:kinesin family protein 1